MKPEEQGGEGEVEHKRFALLLAANDSDYVKKVYGGYFNVFVQAFGDEGEAWDLFRVVEGEFPRMDELYKYDGFVVSGSPSDAYGNDLWILQLCLLLQTLDAMRKKVLGVCFGHQVSQNGSDPLHLDNYDQISCFSIGISSQLQLQSFGVDYY